MVNRNPSAGCGDDSTCDEVELDCSPCCRCVPKNFCAVIENYTDIVAAAKISGDGSGQYSGMISCEGESLAIDISIEQIDGECYWIVVGTMNGYVEFDEQYLISDDSGSCRDVEFSIPSPFSYCEGETILISKFKVGILDLVTNDEGCKEPFCGNCRCPCKTLCVSQFDYDGFVETELEWNRSTRSWGDGDDAIRLIRDEYTGGCLLRIPDYGDVEIGNCDSIQVEIEDDDNEFFVYISCKECKCPEYRPPCACEKTNGDFYIPPVVLNVTVEVTTEKSLPPYGGECHFRAEYQIVWKHPPVGSVSTAWFSECLTLYLENGGVPVCYDGATSDDPECHTSFIQDAFECGFNFFFLDGHTEVPRTSFNCYPFYATYEGEASILGSGGYAWITITE